MELLKKTIDLADGLQVTVCEADATFDARMGIQANKAEKEAGGDPVFNFFRATFYPILYACTRGDVPTAEQAFALPDEKLNEWYRAVWELNPDILGVYEVGHQVLIHTLRDGREIQIHETHDLPSYVLRLIRLEVEAQKKEDAPEEERTFRNFVYPKIAACSNGSQVPSADDAVKLPRVDITAWASHAMTLNSKWFQPIFDEAERTAREADKVKKKRSRRIHHKAGAPAGPEAIEESAKNS
jgi:hypothetical protein